MSLRDLRRHVGRLAIVGFDGHTASDDLRRVAAAFDLGGVIYFARNVVEPAQVGELTALPSGTPDACACTTEDCVANWIDDNLGCDICVLFTCGDEPFAAGCNACP